MSSSVVGGRKEKSKVFEMVLSSPGMLEDCKISLKISRQNALLLCRVIEVGLLTEKNGLEDEILSSLPEGVKDHFKFLHEEILNKAGLSDFYEKLKAL